MSTPTSEAPAPETAEEHPQETPKARPAETSAALRQKAARAHFSALACGLLLPVALHTRRQKEDFLQHHGRQATLLSLGLFAVLFVHFLLYLAILGVKALQAYALKHAGVPPPAWAAVALPAITFLNGGAMVAEIGIGFFLAIRTAREAQQGLWSEYFFSRKKTAS